MAKKPAKKAASKPSEVAAKKDPAFIAKFGDPDADPAEIALRRANFG
jgi:hypothetical protein